MQEIQGPAEEEKGTTQCYEHQTGTVQHIGSAYFIPISNGFMLSYAVTVHPFPHLEAAVAGKWSAEARKSSKHEDHRN